MPSQAQKNRGFLLPAVIDPQQAICVEFQIPDTPEYRAAVRGHVEQLGKHWNWEKSGLPGDNRAGEASQLFKESIFRTFKFDDDCLKCETPFWFDADTVDDDECCDDEDQDCEESEDQNQWLEDAADWIITAFIAATFTPGAAIAYKTVIPRARLFFRTGDLGAIANIFIDGILWGAVNTALAGAPELITTIIDLDEFRQIHNLGPENIIRIVHDVPAAAAAMPGDGFQAMSEPSIYTLEVVRGDIRAPRLCDAFEDKPTYEELNAAYFECYGEDIPMLFDVRVQGCLLQKTTDGGQTWTTVQDLTECAPDNVINFQQVDCTLQADQGTGWNTIFDASCAETETPPGDTGEETDLPPVVGNPSYCAGAKYLTDYLFQFSEYLVDTYVLNQSDVQAFTEVVTLGFKNFFESMPLTGAFISAFEGFINHGHLSRYTWLSNPDNREMVECVIYCAAKDNQGFNENAFADITSELGSVPNMALAITDQQWVATVLRLLVRYPNASKKFMIGGLNSDNTCEAVCLDCADQDWSQNALDTPRIQNYLNGHYPFTQIIAGEFDAGLTRIQTDGNLIHVIWDFAGYDLALWKTGANGIRRILPFPQELEMYIRVRSMETGEWAKEWTRMNSARGITATVEPGYYFDAVEYYAPQLVSYGYETNDFGLVNDFTFFGKRLNPFTLPPEE